LKVNKLCLAIAFVVAILHQAAAQQPAYEEENFPSPASSIKHVQGIAMDSNNCIWLATQSGVYRYDGSRFKHYSVSNTPVLKFERIGSMPLVAGEHGIRWTMADGKGNFYEVDSKSRIQPFHIHDQHERFCYALYVNPVINSAVKLHPSLYEGVYESYTIPAIAKAYIIYQNGDIAVIPEKEMLAGQPAKIIYHVTKKYPPPGINRMAFIRNNKIYLLDETGVRYLDGTDDKPVHVNLTGDILHRSDASLNWNDLHVYKTSDPDVSLFIYKGNIYEMIPSPQSNSIDTKLLITYSGDELPTSLFYSSKQQITLVYFASKGLLIYRPKQFRLLSWFDEIHPGDPQDYYYSMIPSGNGFITINSAGIIRLGLDGEKQSIYKGNCQRFFFFRDRKENLWFQQGLNVVYLPPGASEPITEFVGEPNNSIAGMMQISDSSYYLLTEKAFQKLTLSKNSLSATKMFFTADSKTLLNFLYRLDDHTIWIGTDRGLLSYDEQSGKVEKVSEMENIYLRSACKLADNNYLLGSYDKGIYQYQDHKWIHLSGAGRAMPASAHAFIIDTKMNSVWTSTNEGLLRISLDDILRPTQGKEKEVNFMHFTNFGSTIPAEFNGSSNVSSERLSDTCFAFANAKGLVVFNPKKLFLSPLPSNVLVEDLDDDRKNPRHVEFNPIVPYYGNLDELEIEYILSNADDDWHKLSRNSVISYNNLKPGAHEVHFRIRHQHDPQQAEIDLTADSFVVPYKWYERTWFRWLVAIVLVAAAITVHNIRIWYLRKRKRDLEEIVQHQTRELRETNENMQQVITDLTTSQQELKQSNFLKEEYFAVLTHDLRSPMKFLSFNISHLIEKYHTLDEQEIKRGLYIAYECSTDAHKLVDEFVYWIQENENQLAAQPRPVLVQAVITDANKLYAYSIEKNNNKLITHVDPTLTFMTDPKLLFIILRNAIDNANKYCSDGIIKVTANRQLNELHISIEDTGRGISQEMVHQLMALQYDNVQLRHEQRKSLGFYIMALLTMKLKGRYTITSERGRGTHLNFIFPELNLSS